MILTLRHKDLVYEVIDNEVILLDLGTGYYYSGNRSATLVVELIMAHPDFEVLHKAVGSIVSPADASEMVSEAMTGVVEYLLAEGLLTTGEASSGLPSDLNSDQDRTRIQELLEHLASGQPKFEKHTDMQDILLLDPIHDVSDTGWPLPQEPRG